MKKQLTEKEEKFLKLMKKELFLTGISIRTKIPMEELCKERKDIVILFGNEYALIKDIVIDFVLYKNRKAIAGIELIDEEEELQMNKGEQLLLDTIFLRLGYELFRIIDTGKLPEAAKIIRKKITETK